MQSPCSSGANVSEISGIVFFVFFVFLLNMLSRALTMGTSGRLLYSKARVVSDTYVVWSVSLTLPAHDSGLSYCL